MRGRLPALNTLLGDQATLSLMPSLGWNRPGARSAFDARMLWPGRRDQKVAVQLGVELGGARIDTRSYVRTATDLRLILNGQHVSPWLSALLGAGSGAGPRGTLQASAGAQIGWLELAVRSTQLSGIPALPDTVLPTGELVRRWFTDAELTSHWGWAPYELAITGGRRFGRFSGQRAWGFASLSVPVRQRMGISVAGGWRSEQPERAQPGGGFVQIALRVDATPRPSGPPLATSSKDELSLSVVPLARGYRLRLIAHSAQTAELKGDLSDWEVRAFERMKPGTWELDVDVPPGIYRINVRINAQDWIVPNGLVASPDGFGGMAGTLNLQ
jgi:hypothetical protein